jgi:hypothetical protein
MDWYRVYHGMPQDAKLKVVAHRAKQPMANVLAVWVCLLDAASQNDPRGNVAIDAEQIAVMQDLQVDDVARIIHAFHEKNLLTPENRLSAWDKRQYASPAERVRKHRNRKKHDVTPGNANATLSNGAKHEETQNMTDTDTDYRTDLEKDSNAENRAREEKKARANEKHGICSDETLKQLLEIWNAEVQSKLTRGHNAVLTPQRKASLCRRWSEDFQQDINAWKHYCEIIGESDFCLGRIKGKGWTIDLSWAIESSEHVAKILEGGFSGGNHPSKPPACEVPALQHAWETVLLSFQQKHGKPAYRSWLGNTAIASLEPHDDSAVVTLRCPSRFARDWIAQRYLFDLKRWFGEATKHDARVTGIELIAEK